MTLNTEDFVITYNILMSKKSVLENRSIETKPITKYKGYAIITLISNINQNVCVVILRIDSK